MAATPDEAPFVTAESSPVSNTKSHFTANPEIRK